MYERINYHDFEQHLDALFAAQRNNYFPSGDQQ